MKQFYVRKSGQFNVEFCWVLLPDNVMFWPEVLWSSCYPGTCYPHCYLMRHVPRFCYSNVPQGNSIKMLCMRCCWLLVVSLAHEARDVTCYSNSKMFQLDRQHAGAMPTPDTYSGRTHTQDRMAICYLMGMLDKQRKQIQVMPFRQWLHGAQNKIAQAAKAESCFQ